MNNLKCRWCKQELTTTKPMTLLSRTKDHVKPKSQGGVVKVWACYGCNYVKADMPLNKWFDFMIDNPKWWTKTKLVCGVPVFKKG